MAADEDDRQFGRIEPFNGVHHLREHSKSMTWKALTDEERQYDPHYAVAQSRIPSR